MKLNRTLVLLLIGLVVFEITAAVIVGMTGNMMGAYFVAGLANAMTLIRMVNVVLCGFLVVASLCAGKFRQFSIVPTAACAIELLLGLIVTVIPMTFLKMRNTPEDVIAIAAQGIRTAGVGMLIGMVLAIMAGVLVAKKRIIIPLLVIVVAAILSVAVYYGMAGLFAMGLVSMIAVGFLQPFTFLFPAFGFDKAGCATVTKNSGSESVEKSSETNGYSYLEAYKNKHK